MKIVIGADHRGFKLKELIKRHLRERGYGVDDVGTDGEASVDYTDFAIAAAEQVGKNQADRAVLICGSGAGMSIAANKVDGVRAALAVSADAARLSRAHNDANVLALGAWQDEDDAHVLAIVDAFLDTKFEGGRHARRVDKIREYEERKKS